MNTEMTPPGDLFDRLTEAMPKMAEAVNAFTLKDNQRLALQALLTAAGVPAAPPAAPGASAPPHGGAGPSDPRLRREEPEECRRRPRTTPSPPR